MAFHAARVGFKDHFSTQAAIYSTARPTYPLALFVELARLAPNKSLAWDAGTGNGQAAACATVTRSTVPSASIGAVLSPSGVVALWTYELCVIAPEIDAAVERFYRGPIGPYWPPERLHCESGYRELDFPFAEQPFPVFAMELEWTLAAFTAYLRTWSAVSRFIKEKGVDPVASLEAELAPLWGGNSRRFPGRSRADWAASQKNALMLRALRHS